MRYLAPSRESIDAGLFAQLPFAQWSEFGSLLHGAHWPSIDQLNARWPSTESPRFVAQTPALLADGLHYEERIAMAGAIATRENNWHDLLNALIWLRHGAIKRALNAQQVAEIARMGRKVRSRVQCALTHFDEGGVVVILRDASLLSPWDRHDWVGLFRDRREAWARGDAVAHVFGHAVLEHALTADTLLVGKALVFVADHSMTDREVLEQCASGIARGQLLRDPQELRPMPLSGIPGWHRDFESPSFHEEAACFRPLRAGRHYPPPQRMPGI
jgi:Protein of unknown function (DUF3025)